MNEPRFNVGDMIELVPQNFFHDWYSGTGIILSIENRNYHVLIFELIKINRKRLVEYNMGQQYIDFPIQETDECGYFKLIY